MSEEAIRNVILSYDDAATRGDVEQFMTLFDDDIFWGPNGTEPVRSLPALRSAISGIFGRVKVESPFAIESIDVDGDLAVAIVRAAGTMTPTGGNPQNIDLTEMFALRRRNGSWKIFRQIWNRRSPA